jgi:hypothetical protein
MLRTDNAQQLILDKRLLSLRSLRVFLNLILNQFESLCLTYGKQLLLVVLGLFLASRVFVFYLMIPGDVKFYAQYAYEARAAHLENATIYQKFYPDRDLARAIEYPPLTIELFALMGALIPDQTDMADFSRSFNQIFHVIFFLLDLLTLVGLLIYLFKQEAKISAIVVAVTTYTFAGLILKHFLYSRMDLLLGQLLVLALILMISQRKLELLSFVVLSFAVAFKLIPILLIPIWLIGLISPISSNWARELAKKGAICASIIVLPWIFFAFRLGEESLLFLGVHQIRGIHIESLWGTLAVLLSKFGLPVTVTLFRSYDVAFSLSSAFAALSLVLLVSGCLLIYWIYFRKALSLLTAKLPGRGSIAQRDPDLFKLAMLTTLVFSLAVSKVFSPQYLLWLVPFMLVMPWKLSWGKVSYPIFLLLVFLTALIVPKFYTWEVLRMTWFGTTLLTLRNTGVVLWAGVLMAYLARYRSSV